MKILHLYKLAEVQIAKKQWWLVIHFRESDKDWQLLYLSMKEAGTC